MVLKVPRQVLVHIVLCYRDVQVRVQVAGVLWKDIGKGSKIIREQRRGPVMAIRVPGCGRSRAAPLRYFTLRYSELAFCPSRGALSMTLV